MVNAPRTPAKFPPNSHQMSEGARAARLREITDAAILAKTRMKDQSYERLLLKVDKELVSAAHQGHYEYNLKQFRDEDDDDLDYSELRIIVDHLETQGFKISWNWVVSWKE